MKTKINLLFLALMAVLCIFTCKNKRNSDFIAVSTADTTKHSVVEIFIHPEQKDDEEFLLNVDTCKYTRIERAGEITWASSFYKRGNRPVPSGYVNDYSSIGDKTKRLGKIAYGDNGDTISYLRPVFIKKAK